MSTRHQRFYDGFMLVLGLFLGVLVGIAFMKAFSAASAADRFEVLSERVISGYQGEVGIMPPRGGRADLSDEEILQALDLMLTRAQP